jgi:hypothetical protein
MSYGTSTTLDLPFPDAVRRVRAALQEQGFGHHDAPVRQLCHPAGKLAQRDVAGPRCVTSLPLVRFAHVEQDRAAVGQRSRLRG